MSKYFSESERYSREYEGREYVDQDRRTHGTPIRNNQDLDYNRQLDWPTQRLRSAPNYYEYTNPARKNRQSSVPPTIRRLHYNVGDLSQPRQPSTNIGTRYPPSSYLQSPYTGRYIPSSPAEKVTDSKQTYWPYNQTADERQFNPRSYFDRYEAERPVNKGAPLEGGAVTQPYLYPATTQSIYPTHSPTQQQQTTPTFNQYTSRPGSPQQVVGVGEILNTETGFTIQLDVKHFQAKDLKVTLSGHTLTISGERVDEDPKTEQTLKRSFSRKYSIPSDILLDSIKAHLTDSGFLLIRGQRKNWRETEIPIEIQEDRPKDAPDQFSIKEPREQKEPKEHPDPPPLPPLEKDDEEPKTGGEKSVQEPKEHLLQRKGELMFDPLPHFYIPPYPDKHKRKLSKDSILKNSSATVTI